jgi:hypothetical protein
MQLGITHGTGFKCKALAKRDSQRQSIELRLHKGLKLFSIAIVLVEVEKLHVSASCCRKIAEGTAMSFLQAYLPTLVGRCSEASKETMQRAGIGQQVLKWGWDA